MFQGIKGPLLLIVLDGVGEVDREEGNAVALAEVPFWDQLRKECPFRTLKAHGTAVGLPSDGDMGNSEVGHNALGSGQVYDQGAKLVQDALLSGKLFEGQTWRTALDRIGDHGTLHFIGLLSDGNVHSHIDHLHAMLRRAADEQVQRVRVHILLDGRDVSGTSAQIYIKSLEDVLSSLNNNRRDYRIASGGGRMKITMDRYGADWEMVQAGWNHHVHGQGRQFESALAALESLRNESPGIIDQDLPGFVIGQEGQPVGTIGDGDSVILFNYRGVRAIEISRAFEEGAEFKAFERGTVPQVFFAGMMQYDGDLPCPRHFLVGPPNIQHTMSEFLADKKVSQFAISETQKFGHVTYFWNGNRSGKFDEKSEVYVEIPSDRVSFDQRPWMKAAEITDRLVSEIRSGKHRFLRVNYANGDMVGHTGNLQAAIVAMSCIDLQLQRLLAAITAAGGVALITADHGNCDEMFDFDKKGRVMLDENGKAKIKTSHTLSPVPLVVYDPHYQIPADLNKDLSLGIGSLAATSVELLGFQAPKAWQPSLLRW